VSILKYIIGVDGGGTKTEAIAYSLTGEELSKSLYGYGNIVLNKEIALDNILNSIGDIINHLGIEGLKGIYLGLAGIEVGDNKNIVKKAVISKYSVHCCVINDADLALNAMLEGKDGILTIAGTGSISFGMNKGVVKRCGGWGHLLGDEGSGYYIAIQALKRISVECDTEIEYSDLSKSIMAELKINSGEEIKKIVYNSTKDEIARIAPIVSKLGELGSEEALEILNTAGEDIANMTILLSKKLNLYDNFNIALKGSVLTKAVIVRKAFTRHINSKFNHVKIVDDEISSTKGAYYIYLGTFKK
jgi:N-acetylglucosamine kinase-like BadF-type ATPase